MQTLRLTARISPTGEITVPPIPDWQGDAAETEIVVLLPETEERKAKRAAAIKQFFSLKGCLKDFPDKEFINAKQIRTMRLEERYGDKTPEQKKAAAQKFFDTWNGALEGMPDMTMKEIRMERLEKKYGK
jgi:hypothetical protein